MLASKKRKQRAFDSRAQAIAPPHADGPDPSLFIQAYEADFVRGSQGTLAAQSLEMRNGGDPDSVDLLPGDGLIRWEGRRGEHTVLPVGDCEHVQDTAIWVDRYDARLLLENLPPASGTLQEPSSPGGWSDLPSDTEDTFFFSTTEAEDYRRDKRRRLINGDRDARLRAMHDEENGESNLPEPWGGSDEEPDDIQRELMRRTASHVLGSPNPAQLELRILANHGADQRFAFLRGRWARAWRLMKAKLQLELHADKTRQEDETKAVDGGLTAYADSDDEEDDHDGGQAAPPRPSDIEAVPPNHDNVVASSGDADQDDAVKAARRARAREWAEQRRARQNTSLAQSPEQHT